MGTVRRPVAAACIALALAAAPALAQATFPDGRQLYIERCASCHGANLEGQPNWMTRKPDGKLPAPPHDETGHTWHHSDRQLLVITRDGLATIAPGYVTDMPDFGDQLTDQEILAILDFIKSSWPERQRAFQAARSASDPIVPQ
jgi:mono/diheme cytochrome c family protein